MTGLNIALFLTVAWVVGIGALHTAGVIDVNTRDQAVALLLGGGLGSAGTYAWMKRPQPAPADDDLIG